MRPRPPRTTSLRSRLSWSASAVVAVWVLALAVGADLLLSSALSGQADSVLRARAQATAATVDVRSDGTLAVDEGADDRALDVGTWIIAGDGSITESPPGSTTELDRAATALAGRGTQAVDIGVTDPLRLLAEPVYGDDGSDQVATVVTSTSLAPYRQLEETALWAIAGAAVLLLVIVHLVLRANVGRALRPVQQMSRQAARWSADDVDRRFGTAPRPAELADLAGTLDGVLDRISAVLRDEQRLSAELSHELRTPVARIQAEVDLLDEGADAGELRRAHAVIGRSAEELREVLDTLMTAARAGSAVAPGRTDLAGCVQAVTAGADPRVAVTVDVPADLVVGIDGAVVRRLLQPVVDNAVRHAVARVAVRARAAGSRVAVEVTDDGPGIPAADTERVFEPGWRGDHADGHTGAGLGLALTRRLVVAAGGDVVALPGPGGRLQLDLPAG